MLTMVHEPLPKTKEEPTPLPTQAPTAEPSDGGYKRRHIPWGWIIGGCAAISIAASVINGRLHAVAELPDGLIAVNGRFEGDHVIVSSKYSGRIASLLAREGDSVTKAQLLVRVDDPETRSRRDQASAALQAAQAQESGSSHSVDLTRQNGSALILQAQGLLDQADSGVNSAISEAGRASAAVSAAISAERVAESNQVSLASALDAAKSSVKLSITAVSTAKHQLSSAQAAERSASAQVDASQSSWKQAEREAARYRTLANEGAAAGQVAERAETAAAQAKAQLQAAQDQNASASETVKTTASEVEAAQERVNTARSSLRQAQAQLEIGRQQIAAAKSNVVQSRSQLQVARAGVNQGMGRRRQAMGQLDQAQTASTQTLISGKTHDQFAALTNQARASVAELNHVLNDMAVQSPIAGTVITRFQDQGEVVSAGSPILELVNLDQLYLKVYVPETDIGKIRLGLHARVYTDAFPNQPFDATVGFIASQAEFTPKEIQTQNERVHLMYAVKLYVTENKDHRLTPGLPADAVIRWREDVPWQR